MKKFVLAAVMMLSSVATFAQHEEGSLTIQPRVGVNIASLTKNDGGKARIGLAAGAELEYQVSANIPGAKSVDLSLPIGLSYEYKNFVLDGRYNFGLTKVNEIGDSKNSVFQITAGYKFDI